MRLTLRRAHLWLAGALIVIVSIALWLSSQPHTYKQDNPVVRTPAEVGAIGELLMQSRRNEEALRAYEVDGPPNGDNTEEIAVDLKKLRERSETVSADIIELTDRLNAPSTEPVSGVSRGGRARGFSDSGSEAELLSIRDDIARVRSLQAETSDQVATLIAKPVTAKHDKTIVKLFYATDRAASASAENRTYNGSRGDILRYGTCEVSLPSDHRMGVLETPSVWRLEFKTDADKHVVFRSASELGASEFYKQLNSAVTNATSREVFVFVHGFGNSFADGARRTAQLCYDLQYVGIPIMYSWPSRGSLSIADYLADETNIDWTVPHLRSFLLDIARRSGAERINLVAHSMGNKILGEAVARIASELGQTTSKPFNNVVLTAPDVDADVFRDSLVPAFCRAANKVTLYASSRDKALAYSKSIHGGYRRAGDSLPEIIVSDGMDSIDVSAVDTYFFSVGHSYFGDNRSIISDLIILIRDSLPPASRHLVPQPKTGPRWWLFQPAPAP